ncbi:unnamed protein product [Pylaiella littoralis]
MSVEAKTNPTWGDYQVRLESPKEDPENSLLHYPVPIQSTETSVIVQYMNCSCENFKLSDAIRCYGDFRSNLQTTEEVEYHGRCIREANYIDIHKNRYRKRGLDFQSPYDPFLSHSLLSQVTPTRTHTAPKQKQPIMLYHLPFYTPSPIPEWYIHRRKQVRPPKQFVVHRIKLYPRAN